ncbi:hypothetical protein EVAR_80146_1 [Eumeta japonica]|uniref:Uncharacterized protein n=1 Tax=Eumeta variegata TaxID=151549 RepID=A0A4C1YHV5_EUMVA|nr:hypothetical protein EVAR_80146_1 [Eumeta japonica]
MYTPVAGRNCPIYPILKTSSNDRSQDICIRIHIRINQCGVFTDADSHQQVTTCKESGRSQSGTFFAFVLGVQKGRLSRVALYLKLSVPTCAVASAKTTVGSPYLHRAKVESFPCPRSEIRISWEDRLEDLDQKPSALTVTDRQHRCGIIYDLSLNNCGQFSRTAAPLDRIPGYANTDAFGLMDVNE